MNWKKLINEQLDLLKTRINSDSCEVDVNTAMQIMSVIAHEPLSKAEAYQELGISRSKFDSLVKELEKEPVPAKYDITVTPKIAISGEGTDEIKPFIDDINKFSINTVLYTNAKSKEMQASVSAKYNSKDLLALSMFLKETMAYMKVDPILEKYVSLDIFGLSPYLLIINSFI